MDLKQQQCGTLVKLTQAGDVKTDFDQATLEICEDGDGEVKSNVQSDGGYYRTDKVSQQEEPPIEQIQSLMDMLSQQKFTQVYEHAERLAKQYPNILTLNIMGSAAAQNGQLDQAAFAFDKAINIKPDSAEIHNNIGECFSRTKKIRRCYGCLSQSNNIHKAKLCRCVLQYG